LPIPWTNIAEVFVPSVGDDDDDDDDDDDRIVEAAGWMCNK
jgi:hypothetical protein